MCKNSSGIYRRLLAWRRCTTRRGSSWSRRRGKEDTHEAYCLSAGNGGHRGINAGGYRGSGGSCCAGGRVSDRVRREGTTAFGPHCGSTVHGDQHYQGRLLQGVGERSTAAEGPPRSGDGRGGHRRRGARTLAFSRPNKKGRDVAASALLLPLFT